MAIDPDLFTPIARAPGRRAAVEVHDALRDRILSGKLRPNVVLSQVEIARSLNVSRTPVREAMRMLQEGGLVVSEPNLRSRVLGFDPKDIDALYMKRIVLESLGVVITGRRMTPALLDALRGTVAALESEAAHEDFATWLDLHREFHRLLVSGAGETFQADLKSLELRSERYQSTYKGQHLPGWWQRGEAEHRAILGALERDDAGKAAGLTARHLARTALELLAALAPEHDAHGVRESLKYATAAAAAAYADGGS